MVSVNLSHARIACVSTRHQEPTRSRVHGIQVNKKVIYEQRRGGMCENDRDVRSATSLTDRQVEHSKPISRDCFTIARAESRQEKHSQASRCCCDFLLNRTPETFAVLLKVNTYLDTVPSPMGSCDTNMCRMPCVLARIRSCSMTISYNNTTQVTTGY